MPTTINRRHALLAAGALALPPFARAQDYPQQRPVKLVVPFAPGGSSDVVGRIVGQHMATHLKQTVLVENRTGAGGVIGTEAVARAAPDGYSLLLVDALHTVNPVFADNIPYDAVKDFTPVAGIAKSPLFLVCTNSFGPRNLAEMVALAKEKPGQLTIGIPGTGSIVFEMIRHLSKAQVTVVPYKGAAPALVDLVSGQINLMVISIATGSAFVNQGKLRMLATTGPMRDPDYPDVPTFAEAGLAGVEYEQWFGVMGPANLPKPIVDRLGEAVAFAVSREEVRTRFKTLSLHPFAAGPQEFGNRVRGDNTRWSQLAKDASIRKAG